MPSLNDLEIDLLRKRYYINILSLLDAEEHVNLYGFYLKYLKNSLNAFKLEKNDIIQSNLMSLLILLLNVIYIIDLSLIK